MSTLETILVTLAVYVSLELVAVVVLLKNSSKLRNRLRDLLGLNSDSERISVELMKADFERMHMANFRADVERKLNIIGKRLKKENCKI